MTRRPAGLGTTSCEFPGEPALHRWPFATLQLQLFPWLLLLCSARCNPLPRLWQCCTSSGSYAAPLAVETFLVRFPSPRAAVLHNRSPPLCPHRTRTACTPLVKGWQHDDLVVGFGWNLVHWSSSRVAVALLPSDLDLFFVVTWFLLGLLALHHLHVGVLALFCL